MKPMHVWYVGESLWAYYIEKGNWPYIESSYDSHIIDQLHKEIINEQQSGSPVVGCLMAGSSGPGVDPRKQQGCGV